MSRPLVISDCDEVLLHMVRHFGTWLRERTVSRSALGVGVINAARLELPHDVGKRRFVTGEPQPVDHEPLVVRPLARDPRAPHDRHRRHRIDRHRMRREHELVVTRDSGGARLAGEIGRAHV
mgnify:CR=1 FL=1